MAAARLPVVGEAIDDAVVAGFVSYFAGSNNASTVKGYARSVRQILGEGRCDAPLPPMLLRSPSASEGSTD